MADHHEVFALNEQRGYFYRFTIGLDEAVFECERCGALVGLLSLDRHNNFHSTFSVLAAHS
jgi:hypothetical protein